MKLIQSKVRLFENGYQGQSNPLHDALKSRKCLLQQKDFLDFEIVKFKPFRNEFQDPLKKI